METDRPKILIVDDDQYQLEIYSLLVEHAGFKPVPTIVKFAGPEFQPETDISLILLGLSSESGQDCAGGGPGSAETVYWSVDTCTFGFVAHARRCGS